ncbi:SWIM zinc finger family protein [Dyella choica]|uniref:SWIM zinc finger family protein n=1 Tax=Dyella choica TaxID=1927959 RepID=A0A3S0PNN8_9GAMM|nr:SWIM zinc finger family protein [Dyella choica]RUL75914.1 SWIM zinc finger family protein [Dyella choica]
MGVSLTTEQVLALAPDGASAKAASGLVAQSHWSSLGTDDDAVWGECKGSGAKPYQSQVDLAALVSRCSCPSRKFPCKHALALLLQYTQFRSRFAKAARPAWVDEWLASRKEKAVKKEQAAAEKAPADPIAAAAATTKREAARWKRIESGSADLQRWMADQFRQGLAGFGAEQRKNWSTMAARMIDAQAPGLAQRLEEAGQMLSAGSSRHEQAIQALGLIQLINEGVARREQLSPARLADLRAALGWPHDKEEVAASPDTVTDDWLALGQITLSRETHLTERRIWLHGGHSGRYALLLDFAYNTNALPMPWLDGSSYRAGLHFYPGSASLRALATERVASAAFPWPKLAPDAMLDRVSAWYAQNPWLQQVPMLLTNATPVIYEQTWLLQTDVGVLTLNMPESCAWSLLAFSGGHPIDVMGEWNGHSLLPLSARRADNAMAPWSLNSKEMAA